MRRCEKVRVRWNIPTEPLRTLCPWSINAVSPGRRSRRRELAGGSAQIKRLQFLLGYELLDKSAPGVSLTPRGDGRDAGAPDAVDQRSRSQLSGREPTADRARRHPR